jgi:Zn-dependent peptidase ImmA (M78 family)
MPSRSLSVPEALRIAELQAGRLLSLAGISEAPIPEELISTLPRFEVKRSTPLPVSGYAEWRSGQWSIVVNGSEPLVRQRFSLFHEFKHVLDHPFVANTYSSDLNTPERFAEQVCDAFAANVLMPRAWVKSAYCMEGIQEVTGLARRFGVSQAAMQVRLQQLGLVAPLPRCSRYRRARGSVEAEAVPMKGNFK